MDKKKLIPCPACGKLFIPDSYYDGWHTGKYCCIQCAISQMYKPKREPKPKAPSAKEKPIYATEEFIKIANMHSKHEIKTREAADLMNVSRQVALARIKRYKKWEQEYGKLS